MTVPNTLDSILLNSLVLKEAQLSRVTGYSIKLVEGNGMPLSKLFPTPLSLDVCDRTDECSVCRLSCGASRCTIRSVVYIAECLQCWDIWHSCGQMAPTGSDTHNWQKTEGNSQMTEEAIVFESDGINTYKAWNVEGNSQMSKVANVYKSDKSRMVHQGENLCRMLYIGETSRSLRERADEHVSGAVRMDENNFISKHWQMKHTKEETPPDFIFKVHNVHRDPLSREVNEAVMIQKVSNDHSLSILNSKSEWNTTPLSRLCIDKPEWEKKRDIEKADAEKMNEKARAKKFKISKKRASFDPILNEKLRTDYSNSAASSPGFEQTINIQSRRCTEKT